MGVRGSHAAPPTTTILENGHSYRPDGGTEGEVPAEPTPRGQAAPDAFGFRVKGAEPFIFTV